MEFNQLENMIKISESDSINQASASLFITQSALNQQLIRLEQELGVKLFNRSRTQITPTESGRVFLDYAKQIIRLKRELINVMGDFSEYKTGVIRLGLPTVRGYDIFYYCLSPFPPPIPSYPAHSSGTFCQAAETFAFPRRYRSGLHDPGPGR